MSNVKYIEAHARTTLTVYCGRIHTVKYKYRSLYILERRQGEAVAIQKPQRDELEQEHSTVIPMTYSINGFDIGRSPIRLGVCHSGQKIWYYSTD